MHLVWGTVEAVISDTRDRQRLRVAVDGAGSDAGSQGGSGDDLGRGDGSAGTAVCYVSLTGRCEPGDRVLLNTTAVDLGLGTGGTHFILARHPGSDRESPRGVALDAPSGGHVMKLRYTPLQTDVAAVEETGSVHHSVMARAKHLAGMPVVCCGLHSQVVPVAAAVKAVSSTLRVAYVMSDEAALPMAFSDSVGASRAAGLLDITVTCGQAFGGELEAVNLHSGLLAARHAAGCDVAVVAIGPGVVGTATPFGHGGVAQGEALNAAGVLGGVPVAVLRMSFAETRPRHTPVSHHSLTALCRVALVRARVAMPALREEEALAVDEVLDAAGVWVRHERVDVGECGLPDCRGVAIRSMGRTPEDDPAFFLAAAAAGEVAARSVRQSGP